MADRPRRTRIDWEAAFLYFAQLGAGERTYGKVAKQFGVSDTSVRKHADVEDWEARVGKFDDEAAKIAEHKGVRLRSDRIADTVELVDGAREKFGAQLGDEDFRLTGSGMAALLRMEALLEGEATERVDVAELRALLRQFFEIALRRIPEGERAEAEAEFESLLTGGSP